VRLRSVLFWSCGIQPSELFLAWSITMASYALDAPPSVPLKYILLFGTGALIMRGAGCTINDLWDRNLDNAVGVYALNPPPPPYTLFFFNTLTFSFPFPFFFGGVSTTHAKLEERTKTRPLARGDITPRQAIAFLAPQLTAGLAVLTQLNWYRCAYSYPPRCRLRPKINLKNGESSHTHAPHIVASSWAPPRCPW
jgi:4-hydroxybenzoate polyprenyltransferase